DRAGAEPVRDAAGPKHPAAVLAPGAHPVQEAGATGVHPLFGRSLRCQNGQARSVDSVVPRDILLQLLHAAVLLLLRSQRPAISAGVTPRGWRAPDRASSSA